MLQKLMVAFAVLALSVASAKTYTVTLFETSVVAGTELKPGDYRLDVNGTKVVISSGKQRAEASVKIEISDQKFSSTSVRYSGGPGKRTVQEIRLGGTNTRLIFNP